MKTTALMFSFLLLANAGFSNCSQLRGTGEEAPSFNNSSSELLDLEELEESYMEDNGDDQRELAPSRIRIKVKNTQTYIFKVKAICRDSSDIIRETAIASTINRDQKKVTDITHNRCAKVEVKFWFLDIYEYCPLGRNIGGNTVLTEDSGNEQRNLYPQGYYNGFVIEPNEGKSVINNSKFCFKIASAKFDGSNLEGFQIKYRKDDDDCN